MDFINRFKIRCTTYGTDFVIGSKISVAGGNFVTLGLALSDIKVDSVSIGVNGACPEDGELHTFELIGNGSIQYIGADDSLTNFYTGFVEYFYVDDKYYPMSKSLTTYQLPDGESESQIVATSTSTCNSAVEWDLIGSELSEGAIHFDGNMEKALLDATIYDSLIPVDTYTKFEIDILNRNGGTWNQLQIYSYDPSFYKYADLQIAGSHTIFSKTVGTSLGYLFATDVGTVSIDNIKVTPLPDVAVFNNVFTENYVTSVTIPTPDPEPEPSDLQWPLTGYCFISQQEIDQSSVQDMLAKNDVIICGVYRGWSKGGLTPQQAVAQIRVKTLTNKNGGSLIGKYTINTDWDTDYGEGAAKQDVADEINLNDWWLRDANNNLVGVPSYAYYVNTSDHMGTNAAGQTWNEWYTEREVNLWFLDDTFDFMEADLCKHDFNYTCDWNNDGVNDSTSARDAEYRKGFANYHDVMEAAVPDIFMMPNVTRDLHEVEYKNKFKSAFLEAAMGLSWSIETWGGWNQMMTNYYALFNNSIAPNLIVFASLENNASSSNFALTRYGLASCMLNDGYFHGGSSYSSQVWADEYDLKLGQPIEAPPNIGTPWLRGMYMRRYTNGVVIVNPKGNGTQTVNSSDITGYRRFNKDDFSPAKTAVQDSVNDGLDTTFSLTERNGIILVKDGYTP